MQCIFCGQQNQRSSGTARQEQEYSNRWGQQMRAIDRLKREAKESCSFRGHTMSRFRRMEFWTKCAESICTSCGASVHVDAKPAPNGIDIAGEAVALNCPVEKEN